MKLLKIRTAVLLLLSVTSLSQVSSTQVEQINSSTCPQECIGPCIALGLTSYDADAQNYKQRAKFRVFLIYKTLQTPVQASHQLKTIKGNVELLQTQLIASGMNAKCDLKCFKECHPSSELRGDCFVKCGCSQTLQGGDFSFQFTPWTSQPNKTVFGFGQVWTCEGADCAWNWHHKPSNYILQVTPGGSSLDCNDYTICKPNENDTYAQLIEERKTLFRIVSIAMSEYIKVTNYASLPQSYYDIAKEFQVSQYENLITVSINVGSVGFLIKVERLAGYENSFQVTFYNSVTKSEITFYALTQKISSLEYNVALLRASNYERVLFNQIALKRNETVLTGFNYFINKVIISPGFTNQIDIFSNGFEPIKLIDWKILSALAAASQVPHNVELKIRIPLLPVDSVNQWKIQVLDLNNIESRFRVIAFSKSILGETILKNYTVSLSNIQYLNNAYLITIYQDVQGKLIQVNRFEVTVPQTTQTHQLAFVFGSGQHKWAYQTNSTFVQGYHYVDLKYLGNLTSGQQQLIDDFGNQKQVIYIYNLGNAIAAAISDYPLNIKPNSTTELQTIFISGNQGQINIIDTRRNQTYTITFTEVPTNIGRPVFYVEITYLSGQKAGYYVIVDPQADGTFQVAILNNGKFIQQTYIAGTQPISGTTNFNQITKLDLIATPQTLIDWGNEFITFQNQTIIWPNGVKPDGNQTKINFTDSNYQLINTTGIQINTLNQSYQIYKIVGLENLFIVWGNGSVFHHPNGGFICQGGLRCLLDWLSTELIISTKPGFDIAIDQSTGIQYIIYINGTVTHLNGTFICIGGAQGLALFLTSSTIQINLIQPTRPTFQIIILSNGQIFHLQSWGGQITYPNGTIVIGSLNDLLLQLNQNSKVPITVINNETPKFLIFTFNGIPYFIYQNGTVTTNDNKFITDKGINGFIEWIKNQAQTVIIELVQYTIVIDKSSGNKFYVYSNNTVTYPWGQVLCQGGMRCLQQYLADLYAPQNLTLTGVIGPAGPFNNTYKVYVDYKGEEIWITKEGLIFETTTNKTWIHFDLKDYIKELTFKRTETITTTKRDRIVTVKDLNLVFNVKPDGAVFFSNGTFFTVGGIQGIQKIFNVIGKEIIIGDSVIFEDPNFLFKITSDSYILGPYEGQASTKFCGSNIRQEALVCLWNYLTSNYYLQITGSSGSIIKYVTDQNGTMYLIFGDNKVVTSDGNIICQTGGEKCLKEYIDKLTVVTPQVTYEVTLINGNFYYIFSNGTIYDIDGNFVINGTGTDLIIYLENQGIDIKPEPLQIANKFFIFNGSVITQQSSGFYINSNGQILNVINNNLQLVLQQQVDTYVLQSGLNIVATIFPFTHVENYTIWENTSGRQVRFYANRTYQDHKTLEWVTRLTKDYRRISEGSVSTNGFQILVTEKAPGVVYAVLPNGDSQIYPLGTPITTGGLNGLITYLKGKFDIKPTDCIDNLVIPSFNNTIIIPSNQSTISINTQNTSTFNLIDQQNTINIISVPTFTTVQINNQFFNIYTNGTVVDLSGKVVTTSGQTGLIQYIYTITKTTYTITTLDYVILVDTSTNVQYKLYKDSGKVTHMNETVICTKGGIECLKEWLLEQYKQSYFYIVQTSDGRRYRIYFYGQVIEETTNKVVCEKGGIQCLQTYLNTLQPQYQVAMFENVEYRIYSNGSVITSTGIFISDKGVEGLKAYILTTTYQTIRYLNDEYRLYNNGSVYLKGVFITSNGIEGLKAYLAQSQYTTVSVGSAVYRIYQNGSVYTHDTVKFVTIGGTQGLTTWLMSSQYSTAKVGDVEYRIYSNGTVTTSTGVFITNGGQQGLQTYLQQFQYSVAKVGSVEYRVYSNGTVTTSTGVFVTIGGTVGLQTYLSYTSFQTAQGVFVTTGGFQGLQKYIELTQYQVATVSGVSYHIYQNGTVKTSTGLFITSAGVEGLKAYLASTQFNLVPTPSGEFRVYGNGTVTDTTGKFITIGGIDGLQIYINLISYQTVQTQQGDYRIYGNGTVTDAKGVFVVNGGIDGLQAHLQKSSFSTVSTPSGDFRIYPNGTVTDVKGSYIAIGGVEGLKVYLSQISFQTVQTSQGNFRVYGNGTVSDANGKFVTNGGTNGLQAYFTAQSFQTYQTPQGDFKVYGNGSVIDAKGVKISTGGTVGLQNYLAQFQFQTIQAGSSNYRIYQNGSVYTDKGVLITTGGQAAFQTWFQAQQFQTAPIKGKNYRLYANGTVADDTGKVLSANGGTNYLQGIASGTIQALFSSDNLFLAEQNNLQSGQSRNNSFAYFIAALSGLIVLLGMAVLIKKRRENGDVEKVENDKALSQRLLETEVNF